jgi:hypothetical protein
MSRSLVIAGLMIAATTASAQNALVIKTSNSISPLQPSATVEVWAVFDPSTYALASTIFDLRASPDEGGFSDPFFVDRDMFCDITVPGKIDPDGDLVSRNGLAQVHWNAGCFASPDNPFFILSYTWSTSNFTPRVVDLSTTTHEFVLYLYGNGGETGDFLNQDFAEGAGQIVIVPSPTSVAVLAVGGALAGRRRR